MKIFNYKYLSILLLFVALNLSGQPQNIHVGNATLPDPTVGSLGKYGDIPVSNYTGVPSIDIPIYTVTEGPLQMPISLSYHSSGVKVAEMASWVGMGWSLNAGGVISRTVLGTEDENYPGGFIHSGGQFDETDFGDLLDVINGEIDTEPDIFSISVGGYSGKFYVNAADSVVMVPFQDFKITEILRSGNNINTFVMLAPNGDRYIFGKDPNDPNNSAISTSKSTGQLYFEESSWHLIRVESHDQIHSINLTYVNESYIYKSPASCKEIMAVCNDTGDAGTGTGGGPNGGTPTGGQSTVCSSNQADFNPYLKYIKTEVDNKRLLNISSSTANIDFEANTLRDDLVPFGSSGAKRLDAIEITTGAFCKSFELSYDYFVDGSALNYVYGKRLKLDQVQEVSCSSTPIQIPPYEFTYSGSWVNGAQFLPHRLTKATDHWGFYNGENGNNNLAVSIPPTTVYSPVGDRTFGSANKDSDEPSMLIGNLSQIKYPTGGTQDFTFEANRVQIIESLEIETFSIQTNIAPYQSTNWDNCTQVERTADFTFTSQEMIDNAFFKAWLVVAQGCEDSNYKSFQIKMYKDFYTANKTQIGSYAFNIGNVNEMVIEDLDELTDISNLNTNETYTFVLRTNEAWGKFTLFYDQPQAVEEIVGGVRIKSILTHDGISTDNDQLKTWSYEETINGETVYYGNLLHGKPKYGFDLGGSGNGIYIGSMFVDDGDDNSNFQDVYAYSFNESSITPLSSYEGYHIGYSKVVVSQGQLLNANNYSNGKSVYKYIVPGLSNTNSEIPTVPQQINITAGKELSSEVFNKNNEILASTFNDFEENVEYDPNFFFKAFTFSSSCGSLRILKRYRVRSGNCFKLESIEMVDGVETVSTFTYDPEISYNQPVSTSVANSDNQVFGTTYKFPKDFTGPVYDEMVLRNIIIPIEQRKSFNGNFLDGSRTRYELFNGDPYPKYFDRYEENSWVLQGAIDDYNNGQPEQYTRAGWSPEHYSWTSDGRLLSRSFENFTWSYAYYANTKLIRRKTDIDNQFVDYEYDSMMRLKTIKARNNNVITNFDYHYKDGGSIHNYVKTRTDFTPVTGSDLHWTENWNYMDGLGRSMQTVLRQHSENQKDVINAVEYDSQGRVSKTYVPFTSGLNTGAFAQVPAATSFSLNEYYHSPLNRIHKNTPPSWYPTEYTYDANSATEISNLNGGGNYAANLFNKTVETDPNGNQKISFTDKLGRQALSIQSGGGSNLAKTYFLYDNKSRLETVVPPGATLNSADLNFSYIYDQEDRIIEKKIPGQAPMFMKYNNKDLLSFMQDGNLGAQNKWIHSQYDNYGRPTQTGFYTGSNPNGNTIHPISTSTELSTTSYFAAGTGSKGKLRYQRTRNLEDQSALYSYSTYDSHGRLIQNRGNNHVYNNGYAENNLFSYDYADNLLTQTRYHKVNPYVHLDRTIGEIFLYDHEGRQKQVWHKIDNQPNVNVASINYNIRDLVESRLLGGVGSFSNPGFLQHVDYYYNDQNWLTAINTFCNPNADDGPGGPKGVRLLNINLLVDNSEFEADSENVSFRLDLSAEVVKLNGEIETKTKTLFVKVADFREIPQAIYLTESQMTDFNPAVEVVLNYEEPIALNDFANFIIEIEEDLNVKLAAYQLEDIAMLFQKEIQKTLEEMVPIESSIEEPQYAEGYNTPEGGGGIPTGRTEPKDLFAMQLTYEVGNPFLSASPQLNGNISTMSWQVACNNIQRYGFKYDYQDRLTGAKYAETDVANANYVNFNNYDLTKVEYDQRGNLTKMFRRGNTSGNYFAPIDYLYYNYNGNQLATLSENSSTNTKSKGFTSDDGGNQSYTYDANGNMVSDEHHDISLIEYNHLNLPKKINYENGDWIKWTYDSAGNKLKKETNTGVHKNYFGGIEYKNGLALEAIYHSDGRAVRNGEVDFRYEYTIKDHLGNTRVTFSDMNNDQAVDETEILQENHYYPFGMQMEGSWSNFAPNKYQYNGKELNEDFGLNWLDYGARFYDPALARWGSVDPLADNMPSWSPYSYGFNNPIYFTDPDGKMPDPPDWVKSVGAYIAGAANAIASNATGGFPGTRGDPNDFGAHAQAASYGQTAGDVISVVAGVVETVAAVVAVVGEGAAVPVTGGLSGAAIPATAAIAAHGTVLAGSGLKNLLSDDGVVQANDNQGSGTGRGKNKRTPDSEAEGSHSVSNGRGSTTFEKNSRNPSGFQEVKRVDTQGASHGGVKTPHVHEGGKVRPAKPNDIPTDLSKNNGG